MDTSVDVLNWYLHCVQNDNLHELSDHLASNAVLDWFGRTRKSRKNICDHFRYHLNGEYEHEFPSSIVCDPIECKDTHLSTKDIPPENICHTITTAVESSEKVTSASSSYSVEDGYKTPPHCVPPPFISTAEQLLKLKHDRKCVTDSDSESDEGDNKCDFLNVSGLNALNDSDIGTPSMCDKKCVNGMEAEESRMIFLKRCGEQTTGDEPLEKISKTSFDNSSDEIVSSVVSDSFSELKYLKSVGTIREMRRPQKHRGIVRTNNAGSPELLRPSSSSSEAATGWDREACIKLSYRVRECDNFIQIALIIYKPCVKNPRTRRNLAKEFHKVSGMQQRKAAGLYGSSSKADTNVPPKTTSMSSTKKSLRF